MTPVGAGSDPAERGPRHAQESAPQDQIFERYGLDAPGTEEFWAQAQRLTTPVIVPADDGGWTALFLARAGPARVWFESWSEPVELARVEDTDCWAAEVAMPARLRVTYQLQDDDGGHGDPRNPAVAGPDRSIAATPDAQPQPHWPARGPDDLAPLPAIRVRWRSERLGGRRTVRVHRPGGLPGPSPAVLLLDGDDWLHLHPAVTAFDAAVAAGEMPPAALVFLPTPHDRETELARELTLWEAVRDELLPLLAEHDVAIDREKLVVAGQSYGGLAALRAAVELPDLVRRVACQSGSFWWGAQSPDHTMTGPLGGDTAVRLRGGPDLGGPDLGGLRIAFDVGRHETAMLPHAELVEELTAQAGATVRTSRSDSGHDRAGWRHALVRDVAWAFADD